MAHKCTIQCIRLALFALLIMAGACSVGRAQEVAVASAADDLKSELGEKQRLVEQKMVDLENMFTVIAAKLQDKEPERAEQLVAAYQQAKESLIAKRMAEASQHLDRNEFQQAAMKIDEVIQKLDDLVRLLMNDKAPKLTKEQEIDMLENWKKSIQQMQQSQNQQRRESEKVANKDEAIKQLDRQIKQVEDLIGKQQGLIEQTGKNNDAGIRHLNLASNHLKNQLSTNDKPKRSWAAGNPSRPSNKRSRLWQNWNRPSEI